ncbi:putative signal transducing protein [Vibrio hannami]|uniref:putative signal transducing protein n=1 Tax=Vibrio hannami TaxID=2717094 RepID=UPI003EB7F017
MKIYSAKNPTEAHIVCELLNSEDIFSEVRGDGIFGLKGELPLTDDTDPYVWLCDTSKMDEALSLIESFRQQSSDSLSNWDCVKCGEENEGQFGACWQCGQEAPETVSD